MNISPVSYRSNPYAMRHSAGKSKVNLAFGGASKSSLELATELFKRVEDFATPLSDADFAVIKEVYRKAEPQHRAVLLKAQQLKKDFGLYDGSSQAYDINVKMLQGEDFSSAEYEIVRQNNLKMRGVISEIIKANPNDWQIINEIVSQDGALIKATFHLMITAENYFKSQLAHAV